MNKWICVFLLVFGAACSDDSSTNSNNANNWNTKEDLGVSDSGGDSGVGATDLGTGADAGMTRDLGSIGDFGIADLGGPDLGPDNAPLKHRPAEIVCDSERIFGPLPPDGSTAACTKHEDCTEGANGRCAATGRLGYQCTYDLCFNDSECGEDSVCVCGLPTAESVNHCVTGGCTIDADCGTNGYCSPSFGTCGNYFGVIGYFCHTPEDECVDDVDCGDGSFGAPYCAYDPTLGHWACSSLQCAG